MAKKRKKRELNIVYASHNACIRTIKEGLAVIKQGNKVHFLQRKFANVGFINVVPTASFFEDPDTYAIKIGGLPDEVDLIHVHNEPDWLAHIAKAVRPQTPVIFDCHDLDSVRKATVYPDEAEAMRVSDGFIFPSKGYQEHTVRLHGLEDRPNEVIYSYCNEEMLELPSLPRVNGIVYQGGVAITTPQNEQEGYFSYRDYREVARIFTKMGIAFHVYPGQPEMIEHYGRTGACLYPTLQYTTLMRQLTRYDWGLVGSPRETRQWHLAMPNKLFEFLTAGIPVIVYLADECAEFVREHEVGIIVESLEEIPDIYEEHKRLRGVVQAKRHLWTMESQGKKIVDLYREVLRRAKSKAA